MLNCVIVGAGRSGSHLMMRQLKNLSDEVNIIAICDPDKELRTKIASNNSIPNSYSQLQEALDELKVDIVCVSTPHSTHYEIAKLALENDCSVIVEKPFTETIEQAEDLMQLSKKRNMPIVVVHNHKF